MSSGGSTVGMLHDLYLVVLFNFSVQRCVTQAAQVESKYDLQGLEFSELGLNLGSRLVIFYFLHSRERLVPVCALARWPSRWNPHLLEPCG